MILLLGASGYIGSAFQTHYRSRNLDFKAVSLTHSPDPRESLAKAIRELRPTFLVNCAGFTGKPNVDAAEDRKAECLEVNTHLPSMIAQICADHQLPWGHVSSGCIYTGSKSCGSGFSEEDPPNFDFRHNNCSFYSGSKALAEEVLKEAPNCFLWRLRIPFNEFDHPRNYLTKLMRYSRLLDVRNSISQVDDFVRACCETWSKRLPYGTYNMTNPGSVTTREVAALIEKYGLGRPGGFQFFESEDEFMQLAATTPRASCVLDSSKLATHGIVLREVHDSIEWCLKNWRPAAP
ncbi:MAG: sugar nucleotide-binding protein [Candidatus Methylacidiphilales bacterium]|nr:sugar nucleotide-binding protein [Candidatus Methylacidiphilales bacterium]